VSSAPESGSSAEPAAGKRPRQRVVMMRGVVSPDNITKTCCQDPSDDGSRMCMKAQYLTVKGGPDSCSTG
jgi:hypothetical protein